MNSYVNDMIVDGDVFCRYNSRHLAQEDHLKQTKSREELEKTKSTIRSAHRHCKNGGGVVLTSRCLVLGIGDTSVLPTFVRSHADYVWCLGSSQNPGWECT